MAGTLKVNAVQLGDSATASQNFVLQTNVDGSGKLARGNIGATTQDIITFNSAGITQFYGTISNVFINIKEYPYLAVGDGVTDDTAAISLALAAGLHIYIPPGTYKVTSPLTLRNGHTIKGAGRLQSIISSGVIGASTFKNVGSYTGFIYMSDLQIVGNGLTGASGNGHAINLIDPAIGSGSFTPAQSTFERLYIRNFKGLDVRDNTATLAQAIIDLTAIDACAIICVDGLGVEIKNTSIENCGHGIYFHLTQNCRIYNPLITGCLGWGIHSYDTENTIVYDGDVNTCGTNGVTSATGRLEAGLGTGNVLSARDEGFELYGMKVKGSPGTAQMHTFVTSAKINGCWIRADHIIDKEFVGVLNTQPVDVSISDNDFSPTSGSPFSATRKITHVRTIATSTHNTAKVRVNDNQFRTQASTLVRACVHFQGSAGATRMEGLEVQGNSFGMPFNIATATTIDTDVLLDNGTYTNCMFRGNNHYDATNVTKTAHYEVSGGATYKYNDFDCNTFSSQVTGIIAGIFSGFVPWLESISAAKTFALADGNRSFLHPNSDASVRTWQIPANSTVPYSVGTKFRFINRSAFAVTIAVLTDACYLTGSATNTGSRTLAAYGEALYEKVGSTEWFVSGTGIT